VLVLLASSPGLRVSGSKVAPLWHMEPQVPPNQKGGRGTMSGWLATLMAMYREEGTGEKVGRAGALCAT